MGYKMKGFSGFKQSPMKQDSSKSQCIINEKGETVCPRSPLAPMTDKIKKEEVKKQSTKEYKDKKKQMMMNLKKLGK